MCRSNRPGRSSAGSTRSIRFVAAMTVTLCSSSSPSISVRICEMTRSVTCESSMPPRTGVIASTSSKKMMHGAAVFAFRNVSRTIRSDSPTHLLMNSGPRTEMKFASDSVATALARRVFPVPGGPKMMMPRGGRVEVGEHLVHPERPLDRLPQFLLRLVEAADVLPLDVRLLDQDLAQRGRLHLPVRLKEVVPRDRQSVQDLRGDHVRLKVDVGQDPSEGPHRGLFRKGREIRADVPVGEAREFLEVDVFRERHAPRVDLEDFEPAVSVRDANLDLAVEPARSA